MDRGWLGIVIQDLDRNLARSLGLDTPTGAIVARVLVDGPADQGGIGVEDVIILLNILLIVFFKQITKRN